MTSDYGLERYFANKKMNGETRLVIDTYGIVFSLASTHRNAHIFTLKNPSSSLAQLPLTSDDISAKW